MKCKVCKSPDEMEEYAHVGGGSGDPEWDGPDQADCEACGAQYVEEELVTDYMYPNHDPMPVSVRAYLDSIK